MPLQVINSNKSATKVDNGDASPDASSAQAEIKALEENLSDTKDAALDAFKRLDTLTQLEKQGQNQPDSDAKAAALKRLAEGKVELREKIDSQIKHLIETAKSAQALGAQFNECLDLYNEYQKETQNLLALLKERESKTASSSESTTENPFAKINFRSSTTSGQIIDNSQYLKLDRDGSLMVWTKDAGVDEKWKWLSASENNKKPASAKFTCLYQQQDGSFTDVDGKKVTHLDSYSGRKNLTSVLGNLAALEEGKISSLKNEAPSDLFYQGQRVVFTKAPSGEAKAPIEVDSGARKTDSNMAQKAETQSTKTDLDYQKIGFSVRACDGAKVQSAQYFKLDDKGELLVWQRTSNTLSGQSNNEHTWQKVTESNAKPFRMKFKCLYQEEDGSFTDAQGRKVDKLDGYQGRVSIASLSDKLEIIKTGIVSGMKAGVSHEFFHEGAQVVFTKREKTGSKLQAETTAATTQSPSRKISYHEIDGRGIGHQRSLYARKGNQNELQVFSGKDSLGNDIWLKEKDSSFKALYIHDGKTYDYQGNEIKSITTGARGGPEKISTAHLSQLLSFDTSGIGALPDNMLKAHSVGSKQVVFLKGLPPGSGK